MTQYRENIQRIAEQVRLGDFRDLGDGFAEVYVPSAPDGEQWRLVLKSSYGIGNVGDNELVRNTYKFKKDAA